MNKKLTPLLIIQELFPILKLAGDYACKIQNRVNVQPEKSEYGTNFYATVLTDADLTIQNTIELILLAKFPNIRFFGEEYQKSYNTKYFKSITFGEEDDYLITLDPIDGTRAYLDGLSCFSIVVTIIKGRHYEAVFVLQPKRKRYFYSLKNKGVFMGNINDSLREAKPLQLKTLNSNLIYLSFALADQKNIFRDKFQTWCSAIDYNSKDDIPDWFDFSQGNLAGFMIEQGNLIDSAGFAFMARELGAIVTTIEGKDFEPFEEVKKMRIEGLIIAHNQDIYDQMFDLIHSVSR